MTYSRSDIAPTLGHYLFVFVVSLVLWLLLAGSMHRQEFIAGGAVALVVTLVAGPRLAIFGGLKLTLVAPLHLFGYLIHFFPALVRANLDMARRVLTPSLPLHPAVVEVETRLQSPLGKLLLANSITLTPGTLSVDVREGRILVHWVDCAPGTDLEAATRAIVAPFERHIGGFLK